MSIKGQRVVGLAAATLAAALYSVPSLSAVQTWTYDQATQSFNSSNNGNTLTQFADGASSGNKLVTSGWSDTADVAGTGAGGISNDTIESAKLIWGNTNPNIMGMQDQDETSTGSPHHSIDSFRFNSSDTDPDGEFDMLLLTFDTAVTLNGINLDWALDGTTSNKADVSILAWNGVAGKDTLSGKTWSNVLASNGGGYNSIGNFADVGLAYYAVNTAVQSTKWLIGVYNPAFGSGTGLDGANDGMKLASLTTSDIPTTPDPPQVPVPGTVALVLAGLAALRARGSCKGATL
jgi:hypothetical protein